MPAPLSQRTGRRLTRHDFGHLPRDGTSLGNETPCGAPTGGLIPLGRVVEQVTGGGSGSKSLGPCQSRYCGSSDHGVPAGSKPNWIGSLQVSVTGIRIIRTVLAEYRGLRDRSITVTNPLTPNATLVGE
jgi:hypothetical protein